MAVLTAKYTVAQKNDSGLDTTPPLLNGAMGVIGSDPTGRSKLIADYIKSTSLVPTATVTSNQAILSLSQAEQPDIFYGNFLSTFTTSDIAVLFDRIAGTITGWSSGVNGALNDRYTVTGINIDARTYFNSATWANILKGGDTLIGGSGNDVLQDYGSNNIFRGLGGYDTFIAASGGIDNAIFRGIFSDYLINASSKIQYDGLTGQKGFTVSDNLTGRDGFTQLVNIERLQFTDFNVALDVGKDQAAGQAYMLYKAAFNRPSDEAGLGFWIKGLDNGAKLVDVAQGFINTPEFVKLYGNNVSNTKFVSNLYDIVLHRPLDKDGSDFWVKALDNGVQRANLLVDFATSNENVTQVASLIANGIKYTEFVG